MASVRVVAALLLSGVSLGACNLPVPDYKTIAYPAPYRRDTDGAAVDNEDMKLDAQGYRLDKQGRRIGEVDVPTKTSGESSNAVAGYYISSRGANAPGAVMVPSEGAKTGAGYGPGSATITPGVDPMTMSPPAAGQPVPLTPPR